MSSMMTFVKMCACLYVCVFLWGENLGNEQYNSNNYYDEMVALFVIFTFFFIPSLLTNYFYNEIVLFHNKE